MVATSGVRHFDVDTLGLSVMGQFLDLKRLLAVTYLLQW